MTNDLEIRSNSSSTTTKNSEPVQKNDVLTEDLLKTPAISKKRCEVDMQISNESIRVKKGKKDQQNLSQSDSEESIDEDINLNIESKVNLSLESAALQLDKALETSSFNS